MFESRCSLTPRISEGHPLRPPRASHRAAIGASVASSSTQPDALIVTVQPRGPVSNVGITAGDLIEEIDGSPIADASALGEALAAHRPGDTVTLMILRPEGTTASTRLTLGQLSGSLAARSVDAPRNMHVGARHGTRPHANGRVFAAWHDESIRRSRAACPFTGVSVRSSP